RVADLAVAVAHVARETEGIREGLEPGHLADRYGALLRAVVMYVRIGIPTKMGRDGPGGLAADELPPLVDELVLGIRRGYPLREGDQVGRPFLEGDAPAAQAVELVAESAERLDAIEGPGLIHQPLELLVDAGRRNRDRLGVAVTGLHPAECLVIPLRAPYHM